MMQLPARIAVSVVVLTSVFATAYRDYNGAKLRRDGVLNLYPFPRVGRASHRTWQVPLSDFYLDYEPIDKRQLYAFPRVGRSDSLIHEPLRTEQLQSMPIRRTDTPGMWFGPRLGRSFKSEEDDITVQNDNRKENEEQVETEHLSRKKRLSRL